jgi:hypothetical protein
MKIVPVLLGVIVRVPEPVPVAGTVIAMSVESGMLFICVYGDKFVPPTNVPTTRFAVVFNAIV